MQVNGQMLHVRQTAKQLQNLGDMGAAGSRGVIRTCAADITTRGNHTSAAHFFAAFLNGATGIRLSVRPGILTLAAEAQAPSATGKVLAYIHLEKNFQRFFGMFVAQIHNKLPKGAAAHGRAVDNGGHHVEWYFLAGAENCVK
jgi:hypothetical protein